MGDTEPGDAIALVADRAKLPARHAFEVPPGYLNSASRHPLNVDAAAAIAAYGCGLATMDPATMRMAARRAAVRAGFARLINAEPGDIAFVPSTVYAENMILAALSATGARGHIVTDRLHFFGSVYLYERLRAAGTRVTIVEPVDGRIPLDALERAIAVDTTLVAVSLVSASNGFEHDLAALCERAHARHALVYADIIQAAGATPIDVRASGVDFCACATYKWLMGDMGLGLLYVRPDRLARLRSPMIGQDQLNGEPPYILDDIALGERGRVPGAAGLFEVGTLGHTAIAALDRSLPLLAAIGVERIEAYRQPLLAAIREGLCGAGLRPLTPPESRSAIIAFDAGDRQPAIADRLSRAGVRVTWRRSVLRVAPSLFNDADDVALLVEAARGA